MNNKKTSSNKKVNIKKRNWCFVLYPESAPENWREQLKLTGLQCTISPLHDKDINPNGEIKKAHYHIILCYGNTTTYNNVRVLTEKLHQPIPQALEQIKGYYRYFTHKDNPEKYQYNDNDIVCLNGFNISDYIEITKSEVLEIKKKLQVFICENSIIEYAEFMDKLLLDNNLSLEYEVACNNTYFFTSYIKSKRFMNKSTEATKTIIIDKETGEIIK